MPRIINWQGKDWIVVKEETRIGAGYCPHVINTLVDVKTGTQIRFDKGNYPWTHKFQTGRTVQATGTLCPDWKSCTWSVSYEVGPVPVKLRSPSLDMQSTWTKCTAETCTNITRVNVSGVQDWGLTCENTTLVTETEECEVCLGHAAIPNCEPATTLQGYVVNDTFTVPVHGMLVGERAHKYVNNK